MNRGKKSTRLSITCQICGKFGHSTIKCWHRHEDQYNTETTSTLFTSPSQSPSTKWFLDSGASTHLTSNPNQLQNSQIYNGFNQVVLGNIRQLPIHTTGKGLLPTPTYCLKLSNLKLVPNLSFNLLSIHKLTTDNNCIITFSSHGYEIKDRKTHRLLLTGLSINRLYSFHFKHSTKQ